MTRRGTFRNGRIHVCASMCDTCIFRPGNLMQLHDGRRDDMVAGALKNDTGITCHSTLGGERAVCRGFFNRYSTTPLQLAARMGLLEFVSLEK